MDIHIRLAVAWARLLRTPLSPKSVSYHRLHILYTARTHMLRIVAFSMSKHHTSFFTFLSRAIMVALSTCAYPSIHACHVNRPLTAPHNNRLSQKGTPTPRKILAPSLLIPFLVAPSLQGTLFPLDTSLEDPPFFLY